MPDLNMSPARERRLALSHIRLEISKSGGPDGTTRDELEEYADMLGLDVTRADGDDGEPLKSDFLRALGY